MPGVTELTPIGLSRGHFLVVSLGLVLMSVLYFGVWEFAYPSFWLEDCEKTFLPSLEGKYGFKGGAVSRPNHNSVDYGFQAIDPTGSFAKAGFRVGDIPVDHHGGFRNFCGAMHLAEGGETAHVTVARAPEYSYEGRIELTIASLGRKQRCILRFLKPPARSTMR